MERIVKIIAILIFVICSLFSTSKVVYGVGEYCGEVRYYISFKDDCDKATAPAIVQGFFCKSDLAFLGRRVPKTEKGLWEDKVRVK